MTMVFTGLAFAQLARALASRSFSDPVTKAGLRGNPVLLTMLGAAVVLQLAVVYVPVAQELFGTEALSASQLVACIAVALVVLIVMETDKRHRRGAPLDERQRMVRAGVGRA